MSKEATNFELEHPTPSSNEDLFKTIHGDHVYIQDNNNNVYNQGAPITFNSASISAKSSTKQLLIHAGLLVIPMTHTVVIAKPDGTAGPQFRSTPTNLLTMCIKNHYSMVDRINFGLSNVTDIANNGANYLNVYINEKLKCRTLQECYLDDQVSPAYLDSETSYSFDNKNSVGEVNNNINQGSTLFSAKYINEAILKRNQDRFLIDDPTVSTSLNGKIKPIEGSMGLQGSYARSMTPYFTQTATTLTYHDIITIRLADLNDFFKQQNTPMSQLSNFSLKLYLNNGTSTVTYAPNQFGTYCCISRWNPLSICRPYRYSCGYCCSCCTTQI